MKTLAILIIFASLQYSIMLIKDKKPDLFEKTECNIWTDPYIQKQMLKEHLNFSSDAASRKKESIQKITDFILKNTCVGGNLLDLGCGPGLYTSIFHEKGYTVTGIDFNKASIEYAKQKNQDINYILGDYIESYPEDKFDTAIMIYCDFGTFSDADRDKLLRDIFHSLSKGGKFIFDIFTEELTQSKQVPKDWDYAPTGGFWSENEYLLLVQTFHYPENKAFAEQYNLLSDDKVKHFVVWNRYYNEQEITEVLKTVGFGNVTIHKNITNTNNFTSGNEIFVVAEKD